MLVFVNFCHMFTARDIIKEAFVAYPKLKKAAPDEVARVISGSIETQVKDNYSGGELKAKVTVGYLKSNIKGEYYVVICDICSARCRKAYVKKVVICNVPEAKVLCGKCARIKYKRKTPSEREALKLAYDPEKWDWVVQNSGNMRSCLLALEAMYVRDELEKKARKLAGKEFGEFPAEITE